MDPRYSGRLSPPRRYAGTPARNSTGRLDGGEYEAYYHPRGSRESIITGGPRVSTERIIPRSNAHTGPPARGSFTDDYYVAPRYPDSHRPPSIITTSSGGSSRYRPVITSGLDSPSSPYRSRREDDSYYIQPASSGHNRHSSIGSGDIGRYASTRDPRDRVIYRNTSSRPQEYLSPVVRDSRDREYEYEYTNPKEQVYRDTVPRPRVRRVSDLGSRDRPISIAGPDDFRRQGPPPTTRGLAKIDDDNYSRREYRYPRDEPSSRDPSLYQGSRDERDPRSSRHLVAVHQDDGYSSNIENRSRDKSHRHKHRDSTDKLVDTEKRAEDYIKRHHRTGSEDRRRHRRTDSEDRRHKSHRHRDESEDRRGSRDDGYDRDDEERHRRRKHDESRRDKYDDRTDDRKDKYDDRTDDRKDKYDDRKVAGGLALGAAGVGAAGLVAESLKSRREKDSSDVEADAPKERRRRHRKDDGDEGRATGDEEGEEDRRERRRRRRREREERERRESEQAIQGPHDEEPREKSGRIVPIVDEPSSPQQEIRSDDGAERGSRRHGRRRRDRGSSSDTDTEEDAPRREIEDRPKARVVSPARDVPKPKGILKQPTQQFPVDPNPIREGVAPLKAAGEKGIPPNARWTKVNRSLINPEALELAQERYEERPDYVIILRVVTKDEIEKLAAITQELRARRAAANDEERPRMLQDKQHDSSDSDRPKQITAQPHDESRENTPPRSREDTAESGQEDRPTIQHEGSYQRFAPPGLQPSSIPVYPSVPGRSSNTNLPSPSPISPDATYPSQGGGYGTRA